MCWPLGTVRPRPAASGHTCETNAPTSGRRRRRWSTTTRPTARASIVGRIWPRSVATFMPTGTQDLASCTIGMRTPNLVRSQRSLVGATRDGCSSMCTTRTARQLPKRRSSGSAYCSTSSAQLQARRRTCANRYVHSWPNPDLMSWPLGSISSCNAFPDAASWPRQSAMHAQNWLFAGSDAGGRRAAIFYTIIRTCVLNGIEPEAYLRDVLARIGDYPINRLHELLPWNFAARKAQSLAA